ALDPVAQVEDELPVVGEVPRVDERDVGVVADEVEDQRVKDEEAGDGDEERAADPAAAMVESWLHVRSMPSPPFVVRNRRWPPTSRSPAPPSGTRASPRSPGWTWRSNTARSLLCSARTAPARRRSSAASPASSRRRRARRGSSASTSSPTTRRRAAPSA